MEQVQQQLLKQFYANSFHSEILIFGFRCERSIKPFVQSRKQWLFSDTPNGAEASSIIYSIIETTKENFLQPFYYLKFLLEKLPSVKLSDLEKLLSWSSSLPDSCHIPEGAKNINREKNKMINGHLHLTMVKLRNRIFGFQGSSKDNI